MSLTASAHAIRGTLRQHILIDGQHHLVTDEPEAVGGDGIAPSPHELLPAALASCVSTVLVMYGRTKGWDLGDVDVEVDYDNVSAPRHFAVRISFTGDLTEEQLRRLEKVAETCPVRRAMVAGMEFVEEIELSGAGSEPARQA
jgi:putative redox protein